MNRIKIDLNHLSQCHTLKLNTAIAHQLVPESDYF